MNAYLVGPTLGYPNANARAFGHASKELMCEEVMSGLTSVTVANPEFHDLRCQVMNMLTHDLVVALNGWEKDPTSKFLVEVALRCELSVLDYPDLDPVTNPVG